MNKETLEMLANKLMFTMKDDEYQTLLDEFEIILKQMDMIGKIDNIENVEPMVYPFKLDDVSLREDEVKESTPVDVLLQNSPIVKKDSIVVPRIME